MPVEIIMPKVDMDMSTGTIAQWHVSQGDRVEKGLPLFDIETDKAIMEIEAPATGVLGSVSPTGVALPIGAAVAWLYEEGEVVGEPPHPVATASEIPASEEDVSSTPLALENITIPLVLSAADTQSASIKPRATPRARNAAREKGLDLAFISGTGPRGRVQYRDIEALSVDWSASKSPQSFDQEVGDLVVSRTEGSGTPFFFFHGFANDATSWFALERRLVGRTIIKVDLPCHGKSPNRGYADFPSLVAELRTVFDKHVDQPVHLVAHSLGGALALAVADTRPRKIESLTLIAPAGLGPQINADALSGILRASQPQSLKPWLELLVADSSMITDAYSRAAMVARESANLRAAQARLASVLFPDGTQSFSLKSALERLDMPTKIIWGKADQIIPWQHALQAPGRVALHLLDGVGHMPHVEAPEELGLVLGALK